MINHVVMLRIKPEFSGKVKLDKLKLVKKELEKLPDLIPEIKHYEVGLNISQSPAAFDLVLISYFDSLEKLKTYSSHPEHQKVLLIINETCSERAVVDFEF